MRIFSTAVAVAALALAAPVWAHGGHGHHGHHRNHHGWDDHRHHSDWGHRGHRHHHYYRHHVRRDHVYYYPAYPVYAAPPPGVHIVMPNVYIPLR